MILVLCSLLAIAFVVFILSHPKCFFCFAFGSDTNPGIFKIIAPLELDQNDYNVLLGDVGLPSPICTI